MKREATSSPDDGPKKEKRKYIRKPKAPTGGHPSGAEAPASSLMDVVWGDSSPVTNNGNSLPNPQVVPAVEKDEKGNTKGASAAGKVVKGKGKAGLDGKKGKQASDSGNDVNRDGEGNTLMEGKKSTAGQCFCPSWNSALIVIIMPLKACVGVHVRCSRCHSSSTSALLLEIACIPDYFLNVHLPSDS
jgi:hypothetical protein